MDKKLYQLLAKNNPTPTQNQYIIDFISHKFFKSLITTLPIHQLIQNIKLKEWPPQTIICQESQKINSYFFLLEGSVNLYKKVTVSEDISNLQIVKNINEPQLISDSLFSHSPHRIHTVITTDSSQGCKGFVIQKSVIEELCGCLIKEYKILKSYFCSFLNLSTDRFYKIDLYENVRFKTLTYGQNININNQIYIIYSGECEMNFQQKNRNKKRKQSPFRVKMDKSRLYKPLLKLCQNECIGMQLILPQNSKPSTENKFKYIVSSEKLVCITISIDNLSMFPKQLTQKLQIIHESHLKKLEENVYFKNVNNIQIINNQSMNSRSLSPILKGYFSPIKTQIPQDINTGNTSRVRQKFTQIPFHKTQNSPNKKSKSRFRLPNLKQSKLYEIQNVQNSRLNKTQHYSQTHNNRGELMNLNSSINMGEIIELRKRYCIGFDLKSKCDRQSQHVKNIMRLRQTIRQPKGYFPFSKIKNKKQSSNKQNNNKQNKHKQWSYYIKLPKII